VLALRDADREDPRGRPGNVVLPALSEPPNVAAAGWIPPQPPLRSDEVRAATLVPGG
jgi:hypothetical protein